MVLENWVDDVGVKLTEHISTTNKTYPDERSGQKTVRIVVTDPYATDSDDGEGNHRFVRRIKRHVEEIYFGPPIHVEEINFDPPKNEIQVQETRKKKRDVEEIEFGPPQKKQQEIEVQESKKFRGLCQARMSAAFYRGTYDHNPEGAVRIYDIAALSEAARFYESRDSSIGEEGSRRFIWRKKKQIEEINFGPPPQEQIQVQETKKKKSLVSLLAGDDSGRKRLRGVHQTPLRRWSARVRDLSRRKNLYIGAYDTPEEVARIFVRAAIKLRGFNTVTNFSTTDISIDRSQTKSDGEMGCKYPRPDPRDDVSSRMKLRGVCQGPSGRWGKKKFRGVRQRPSWSWGAEIPEPTRRRNVYLGTRRRLLPIKKRHVAEINFGPPQSHQQELEVSSGDNVSGDTNWMYSSVDEEGSQRLLPIKKRHIEEINFGN